MAPNETAMTCKETAKAILGVKTQQQKRSAQKEIQTVSSQQKKMRDGIEPTNKKEKKATLRKLRSEKLYSAIS